MKAVAGGSIGCQRLNHDKPRRVRQISNGAADVNGAEDLGWVLRLTRNEAFSLLDSSTGWYSRTHILLWINSLTAQIFRHRNEQECRLEY